MLGEPLRELRIAFYIDGEEVCRVFLGNDSSVKLSAKFF